MEAPPQPLPLSAAPTTASPAAVYPESIDFSPRSRQTDSGDTDLPPPSQKLRLMCSYGGNIVPRPHDKILCYIGGDTRIIVLDRHTPLSDLRHRLSKTLLHNQPFALKYQLPKEDLDSLISVTTDEDLENMVEEYDRLNIPDASGGSGGVLKQGRLRLFLFPQTPFESVEQLLAETMSTKSVELFLNALNGKESTLSTGASDRGFSESSSVNCLLGLDDDLVGKAALAGKNVETQIEGSKSGGNGNDNLINQDANSIPDSPMLDTTSSFGSTSSSPSVANLPRIRVHVDENPNVGIGIEDQFQQMKLGVAGNVNLAATQKSETGGLVASGAPVVVGGEYPNPNLNRAFSDDERSDHGGYRNLPQDQPHVQAQLQQMPMPQFTQKQAVAFDLASPDSISSEGSMANPSSWQRQYMYQDPFTPLHYGNTRVNPNQTDPKTVDQNNSRIQMQPQVQESSGYLLSTQYEQNHPQKFFHAGNQYISAGPMPIPNYYPIYPSQQQNHPHQPAVVNQQYPYYFVQAGPTQGYNIPMQQTDYNELAPNPPSSRPQMPPNLMVPHGTFNQGKPEFSTGVYRTSSELGPQLVQVPSSQHQAQYVGFTQIRHRAQSIAPSSAANSNCTYEFADPNSHTQMFYNQALTPQMSAHYQTLASASTVAAPDASGQVPTESTNQHVRNLQP